MRYALIILLSISFSCSAPKSEGVQIIDTKQLQELIANEKDLVILDVRTPAETNQGMIPGAVHIDWQEPAFVTEIAKLDPKKPIVVYCASGMRSAQAAELMKAQNFYVVYDYSEGYYGWMNTSGH